MSMALSRHGFTRGACLLSGVQRTSPIRSPMSANEPKETLASVSCLSLARSGLLSGGFEDQPRDFLRVRDQREMAGLHLDGLGAHPLGHEALEIGIDRAVLGRNRIEARFRTPRGLRGLSREESLLERLLNRIEHLRLRFRQVAREITHESL